MNGVTVCVPCYEQAEFLPIALESVAEQTVAPLEVIVVDDGSPTQGVQIAAVAAKYGADCVRVQNRGLPNARNVALGLARGDGFVPLDSDDWLDECYVEKTLPLLTDADVVCTGLQEHGARSGVFMPGYNRALSQVTVEALQHTNLLYYCSLFKTSSLRRVGGWNGRMVHGWEDWALWRDVVARGWRFAEVREVLFHYLVRLDGMAYETDRRWQQWNHDEMARHRLTA